MFHYGPYKYCFAPLSSIYSLHWAGITGFYQPCYSSGMIPLPSPSFVGCGVWDKSGGIFIRQNWQILPDDTIVPWVGKFDILYILNIHAGITDWIYLMLAMCIFTSITYFCFGLLNIIMCIYHVNYIKDGSIFNIMNALLEYFLLHELIRLMSQISHILHDFILLFDEGYSPSHVSNSLSIQNWDFPMHWNLRFLLSFKFLIDISIKDIYPILGDYKLIYFNIQCDFYQP